MSFALRAAVLGAISFLASAVLPSIQLRVEAGRRNGRADSPAPFAEAPRIDVIVPAYLEASVIESKIRLIRSELESWPGSTITVVASDEETARAASGADSVLLTGRLGKSAAVNVGVDASTADIVVLTDANCTIQPHDWPRRLVDSLARWNLVSGHKTEEASSEKRFWAFERSTKDKLSSSYGTLSVVGEFLAFRRADFVPLPHGLILDDLAIAENFVERGMSTGIAPDITTVEPPASPAEQWERRVRIAEGLFREQLPQIDRLSRTPQGRLFLAHKMYRVTIGAAGFWVALAAFTFAVPVLGAFSAAIAALSILVYRGSIVIPVRAPFFVTVVGLQAVPIAAALRILKSGRGPRDAFWEKIAR